MSLVGNGVIGIRREDKNKWERRVPLTPAQVESLVKQGIRVIVQPSTIRVFPTDAYARAGAEISEDLTPASLILAVKEVPISLLIPERTYMFFSHTIKAQVGNMPLLDAIKAKNIRMIDYECITEGGLRGGKRLVAFGRYAGIAGAIDFMSGFGERLLSLGLSTPFLSLATTVRYPTLQTALEAITQCGKEIAEFGLPEAVAPLTIVFTGNGNVSKGAQHVFGHLPIKFVAPEELKTIRATATGKDRTHVVYAAVATECHMVRKKGAAAGAAFDKEDYKAHPDLYESIFHEDIIPHTSVLMNCMYWEPRFPRLLTIAQAKTLKAEGRLPLLGVGDITCDFEGSVQFLKEFTTIEKPFYVYDVDREAVVHDMDAPGILYHAVDHLPSECPRDASEHFGKCLLPLLPALARSDGSKPFEEQTDIPEELRGAIIACHGHLTPNFDYICTLREANERAKLGRNLRMTRAESFVTVDLHGHLFDTGAMAKILDTIEEHKASARILDFHVGKDRSTPTQVKMQVFSPGKQTEADARLRQVLEDIHDVSEGLSISLSVDAKDSHLHAVGASAMLKRLKSIATPMKRILVLGAGFVSAPLVEYLLRQSSNCVTVASVLKEEAEKLARGLNRIKPIQLDVSKEMDRLEALVAEHDIVVSLVPAPCHPPIARAAIKAGRNMVTASYISPEMRALDEQAKAAKVIIINEAGLDPGIDHMSAKKMIDDAVAAGGTIVGFTSVCGGLPAPEAANNPLGYKFSWSPRGVMTATRNNARYLRDGHIVEVPGEALLASATPYRVNPAFSLECIPNRDSLPYADLYGINTPHLKTMYRGTLRYSGFCALMHSLTALGFLSPDVTAATAGCTLYDLLAAAVDVKHTDERYHDADYVFQSVVKKVSSVSGMVVREHLQRVAALSAALGDLAAAGAQVSSNISLEADVIKQQELKRFLDWAGFFDRKSPAPLRGGAAGDGITTPRIETALGKSVEAGTAISHVPLDTIVAVLTSKPEMSFVEGERDMALMRHELEVVYPDGTRQLHTAMLVEYADLIKKQTAMSRTVGFTAAIAAQCILDGKVAELGVLAPLTPGIYAPILEALEGEGIRMQESVKTL